ncbi:hypothetical protein [Pseudomonas savastanoi]|uniref:hypothetical protein n=1 Tax=Pseudomonas savastanoi TaxID=29438 RepID=UPI000EFE2143
MIAGRRHFDCRPLHLSVSEGAVRIQIEAPDFVEVREVSDRKHGPAITHKRRRSLVTRSESR